MGHLWDGLPRRGRGHGSANGARRTGLRSTGPVTPLRQPVTGVSRRRRCAYSSPRRWSPGATGPFSSEPVFVLVVKGLLEVLSFCTSRKTSSSSPSTLAVFTALRHGTWTAGGRGKVPLWRQRGRGALGPRAGHKGWSVAPPSHRRVQRAPWARTHRDEVCRGRWGGDRPGCRSVVGEVGIGACRLRPGLRVGTSSTREET